MANFTTPVTIALNKQFKGRAPRIQAGAFGSVLLIRMEDPEGLVSVKLAREITIAAHKLWVENGMIQQPVPTATYHMDGVVASWSVNG